MQLNSTLLSSGYESCLTYFSLADDKMTITDQNDLCIGRNVRVSRELSKEDHLKFRDLVVLGSLILGPKDYDPGLFRAALTVNNIIIAGSFNVAGLAIESKNAHLFKNYSQYRTELGKIVFDYFRRERIVADRMGLKSILT